MKREKMIECFKKDVCTSTFRKSIEKLVKNISKKTSEKVYAGVHQDALYVLDTEYHLFCGKNHITIRAKQQDPWLSDYYRVSFKQSRKDCGDFKQVQECVETFLKEYIRAA